MDIDTLDIFKNLIFPFIIAIGTVIITNLISRKKRKAEVKKLNAEIEVIKQRFQPVVISTLIKTHEFLIEDKINALRKLLEFKENLMHVDISYHDGRANIDDVDLYYDAIYEKIGDTEENTIKSIISKYGYLFRDRIVEKMNKLSSDISKIHHIQKEEFSMRNREMPDEAASLVSSLSNRLSDIIELIREDLHINDDFIHTFINSYKSLEDIK